uniref:Uncharacterized protein n=1 Tax=Arundo donax TaxID=35708 RepID=A0A0A9H7K9_ARUDO
MSRRSSGGGGATRQPPLKYRSKYPLSDACSCSSHQLQFSSLSLVAYGVSSMVVF